MQVNRSELLGALEIVSAGLAKKKLIDQADCFVFKEGRIVTYNDELCISKEYDLGFEGAIRAKEFQALLSKMKDESIDITESDGQIVIKGSKRITAGLPIDNNVLLPIADMDFPDEWHKLPKNFKEALQCCIPSCGRDMTKPKLVCVHLKGKVAEASDGYRIINFNLDKKIKEELLIPYYSASEVSKHDVDEFGTTNGWAHFRKKDSDMVFSCRVTSNNDPVYPDLAQYFTTDGTVVNMPDELVDMIDRAAIFSDAEFAQDQIVFVEIKSGKCLVKAEGTHGWIKEKIKTEYDDEPLEFAASPMLLKAIIKNGLEIRICENSLQFECDLYTQSVSLHAKADEEEGED